jgi:hypothetical protein
VSDYVIYSVGTAGSEKFEVRFECEPAVDGTAQQAAAHGKTMGVFRAALRPLVAAAAEVVAECAELKANEIALSFGIKTTAEGGWMIGKAGAEANFAVAITWRPDPAGPPATQ